MNIHTIVKKFSSDGLARNSAIVFAGTMGANAISYLYHLIMGRLLGPVGYGELSSLLSLLYLFTVPMTVAQTVLVKFVSGFKAHGKVGQAKTLFMSSTKLFLAVCLVGIPAAVVATPYITEFLHLSSGTLMTLLYILLTIALLTVGTAAMLNGYQKFIWVSVLGILSVLIKLLISIPLVPQGVPGIMFAAVLAAGIIYVLYFVPLRFLITSKAGATHLLRKDMLGFAVPTLLATLGITSLFSTDIILVRHFFNAQSSGMYAALAILGKIIFYASSAIPVVLFPIAAERTALGYTTKKFILSSVAAVAAISACITGAYFLFPDLIVRLLFGNAYSGAGTMLGLFGIFLGLFSIANIIATASLAVGNTKIWLFTVGAALVQAAGIIQYHGTIRGVILINIIVCLMLDIATGIYYLRSAHEKI